MFDLWIQHTLHLFAAGPSTNLFARRAVWNRGQQTRLREIAAMNGPFGKACSGRCDRVIEGARNKNTARRRSKCCSIDLKFGARNSNHTRDPLRPFASSFSAGSQKETKPCEAGGLAGAASCHESLIIAFDQFIAKKPICKVEAKTRDCALTPWTPSGSQVRTCD